MPTVEQGRSLVCYAEWRPAPRLADNHRFRWRDVDLQQTFIYAFPFAFLVAWNIGVFAFHWRFLLSSGQFITQFAVILPVGLLALPRASKRAQLEEVAESLAEITPFPALLTLSVSGVPYDQDYGSVIFFDGWLHFQGEGITFSLDAWDIDSVSHPATSHELNWCADDVSYTSKFAPLPNPSWTGDRSAIGFERALKSWMSERAVAKGTAMFPPNVPPPEWEMERAGVRRTANRWICVGVAGVVLSVVGALPQKGWAAEALFRELFCLFGSAAYIAFAFKWVNARMQRLGAAMRIGREAVRDLQMRERSKKMRKLRFW